jgi:tRNA 2-thiouridine synthesizing protein A
MGDIKADKTVDTSGHCCPVPIIETNRAMKQMRAGEVLEVISTDTGSKMDIPAWCARTGNKLLRLEEQDKTFRYYVRKRD